MKYTKIGAVSLGCSKNAVDTEIMLGELNKYGFTIVPSAEEAEIIIVNTCGFIESAKTDSIETILEMAQYKKAGSCKLLIVTGCLSQRYPDELKAELPEVDLFHGVKDYPALAAEIAALCGGEKKCASGAINCGGAARLLTTPPYRAYLRIADGCDNCCTYCAIPLIRGGRVSFPMEKLIDEARSLAENGVKELTVIAQDTSAYGIDIYGKPMLKELLIELCKIDELRLIRVLYAYPNTVTKELVDTIASEEKLANYIDMPIQHISKRMLKAMNRHGSAEHIREITDYIRSTAPDFILRTTVMLGFPGETDADFNELTEFLREHPFDRVGAFTYSREDGTPASELPDQLDASIAQKRLDEIMKMQRGISLELNKKRVGSVVSAIIDSVKKTETGYTAIARSYAEEADVDGVISVKGGQNSPIPAPGSFIKVRITNARQYDLDGVVISEE